MTSIFSHRSRLYQGVDTPRSPFTACGSSLRNSSLTPYPSPLTNRPLPAVYRDGWHQPHEPVGQDPYIRDQRLAAVEAALLVADEPLSIRRLATAAGLSGAAEARRLVQKLQSFYEEEGSAFQVEELAGGLQLLTRPEYHAWLMRLRRTSNEFRLSAAAKETLAIVAYRQPITRADLEAIRGVQSAEVLRLLMEKGLVRIAGRHDSLAGRCSMARQRSSCR